VRSVGCRSRLSRMPSPQVHRPSQAATAGKHLGVNTGTIRQVLERAAAPAADATGNPLAGWGNGQ
jgi:hypothetical protein